MFRLTAIILLAGCLQLSAKSYGQHITISKKNASLQELFLDIYKQSGYFFYCRDALLVNAKKVDIEVKDASLEEVLEICFRDQPLTYSISDKVIVVALRPEKNIPKTQSGIDVKGKVLNEKGEPLEGAAVVIKGSRNGTQTDAAGNFELKQIEDHAILEISFTGYGTKTVSLNGSGFLTIILTLSMNPLDQVQVIAYGTTSKRLNTGNVSTVTAETIAEQPVSNPLAALEGRVPGMVVTQQTGVPGGGFTVQIRGQNSIANGNNPLYIIDGVPFPSSPIVTQSLNGDITFGGSPLSIFNPSDIESINVLKDADATAIYGSRGANGIILITTKRGKSGKLKAEINASTGIGHISNMMHLLNTSQYLEMRHEAFANDGASPIPGYDYDLLNWDTTRYTDWQKTLIGGSAKMTDIQGSVSGGNANTQYLFSGVYHRETTVFPGDFSDQKGSAHIGLTSTSFDKKFSVNLSASYMVDNNHLLSSDFDIFIPPVPDTPPVYDSTGKLNWANGTFDNPFGYLMQKYNAITTNLIGNTVIGYQVLPGLVIKSSLGYTKMQTDETLILPGNSYNPSYNILSSANFATSSNVTWILEPQIEYHHSIGNNHLTLLAGSTFQNNTQNNITQDATGFNSDALLENIAAASTVTIDKTNTHFTQYRYEAFFARINYAYFNKYLINLNGRRDGSSRFGPGKQFANFGSIGAAWIFSKEKAIENALPIMSFGKLRFSYGVTGNDQIGDYQYLSTYTPTTYPYQTISGLRPTHLLNPDYGWESVRKMELGLTLGFFKDRILLETSFYKNRSSNQLVGYGLPAITGFTTITANLPAIVQNSGIEFELNATTLKIHSFKWTTYLNLSIPRNLLVAYPNIKASTYANTYFVGKSLSVIPALRFTGVDPSTGVYTFLDVNGNGSSFDIPADLLPLKKIDKSYYGGVLNSLNYKGFQLDIFFQFVKQTGYNYLTSFPIPGTMANQPTYVLSRWQKPGDISNIQQFTQGGGSGAALTSYLYDQTYGDNRISDASFIRLKNINLSYSLSAKWISKLKVQKFRIYLQGQNLLTITHYQGMDPENNGTNQLPPLRVLTAGVQLTF